MLLLIHLLHTLSKTAIKPMDALQVLKELGYDNVTVQQLSKLRSTLRTSTDNSHAAAFVNMLQELHAADPDSRFLVQVDETIQLCRVFWMSGRQRVSSIDCT